MDATTVNIPQQRYIELLENENKYLRHQLLFIQEGCTLTDVTRRIHETTGKTLKQWAADNGFEYQATRNVACGQRNTKSIVAALAKQGYLS